MKQERKERKGEGSATRRKVGWAERREIIRMKTGK
jgi:hypothetical protein